jgi:hypothetical protein
MSYALDMTPDHPHAERIEHLWILGLAVLALLGSFLLRSSPGANLQLLLPWTRERVTLPETCASRVVFGISCPGCGLTRSFVAMARGDVGAALRFNPMGPVLFVLCWLQIPYRLAEYWQVGNSNRYWVRVRERLHLVTWAMAVGLLGTWALGLLLSNASMLGFS